MFTVIAQDGMRWSREIEVEMDSVRFSTNAVGGFGSCSFKVNATFAWRNLPKLVELRMMWGHVVLWEGRVEDRAFDWIKDTCTVTGFGFQRVLEETSVKRIYSLRTISWEIVKTTNSLAVASGSTPSWAPHTMSVTVGRYDDTDLTKVGLRINNQEGITPTSPQSMWATYQLPDGMVFVKARFQSRIITAGVIAFVQDSVNGATWTNRWSDNTSHGLTERNVSLGTTANRIVFGGIRGASGDEVNFNQIRLLCTSVDEDVTGGFYPAPLIRDLIALCPELKLGVIDNDTSYVIEQLSRSTRDTVLSMLQEVSSYYARRWGVWEDKRFDWRTPDYESPYWTLDLAKLTKCEIEDSVDGSARKVYVLFADAASGYPKEVSYESVSRRNDYVRQGKTGDIVVQAPVTMTTNTAQGLANRIGAEYGQTQSVRGQVELPFDVMVDGVDGAAPAFTMRAGQNVVIPELPTSAPMVQGRDGETVFHISSTNVDTRKRRITLELEGYSRQSDIILARLAASTRTLAG